MVSLVYWVSIQSGFNMMYGQVVLTLTQALTLIFPLALKHFPPIHHVKTSLYTTHDLHYTEFAVTLAIQ